MGWLFISPRVCDADVISVAAPRRHILSSFPICRQIASFIRRLYYFVAIFKRECLHEDFDIDDEDILL